MRALRLKLLVKIVGSFSDFLGRQKFYFVAAAILETSSSSDGTKLFFKVKLSPAFIKYKLGRNLVFSKPLFSAKVKCIPSDIKIKILI